MVLNPFRRSGPSAAVRQLADDMQMRADAARDAGEYLKAAYLFAEVVRLAPNRAGLLIQSGHMFKEAGEFAAAEQQYELASRQFPKDAELALQLGHFFKTVGRMKEAHASYQRALALSPGWGEPQRELDQMAVIGLSVSEDDAHVSSQRPRDEDATAAGSFEAEARALHLAAELAPRPVAQGLRNYGRSIEIRQLGRVERSFWGRLQTLRGVEAIQGLCISDQPIQTITLMLNRQMVYRGPVRGGYPLPHDEHGRSLKYVFNVWIDFTEFLEGPYELEYRATDIENRTISRTEWVVIAPPLAVPNLPDSDSNVPRADPQDARSLDDQINARPSMVRPARRALFKQMPKTILVQRPDVLGDLVVSVPALKRLRSLFPDAHFVGVISKANRDLAENLGFFDELVETDLAFDHWEQRRVVTLENQRALAKQLAHYEFDLAIDLCAAGESRLLLPLAGTPVMVGFRCGELPGLTVEVTGSSNDPWNGHDMVPHTNKALALVEWLGAMMRTEDNIVRRPLDRALLADLDIPADADYIVLHAGGRWDFSQWPHYPALVELLLARTDFTIVLLANDAKLLDRIPAETAQSDRFRFLARRLSFDTLDALVSLATVFVGDDSGVKHLAALRGTKVIGIQNARNNWAEWGHENEGFIMTRKLPCAGCQIQHYPESLDCGRDFICITGIKPEEVLTTVQRLMQGDQ
ncbi:glycosyltransferase family 9 protein [Sphingomonas sp.]|uniref:glycosyltransferase family 9 protein n=1 Tax=Sphingomonas sp. TaxID=28214 RepID=UPI003B3A1800